MVWPLHFHTLYTRDLQVVQVHVIYCLINDYFAVQPIGIYRADSFYNMPMRRPDKRQGSTYRSAASSHNPRHARGADISTLRPTEASVNDERKESTRLAHAIDESMGFVRYESGKKIVGWLCNMHSTSIEDEKVPGGRAAVDYYFIQEDGATFKATVEYDPYFLIAVKRRKEAEVEEWCRRKFDGLVKSIQRIDKEDLRMPNHLLGYRRTFLRLNFANVSDLLNVRKSILPIAEVHKKAFDTMDIYAEVARYATIA